MSKFLKEVAFSLCYSYDYVSIFKSKPRSNHEKISIR